MKLTNFFRNGLAASALAVLLAGCGGEKSEKSAAENTNSGKPATKESSTNGDKDKHDSGKKNDANAKPVKVTSNLPHKDLDPMSTDKGIEPGRLLIDAKGQDANGKPMKLSDYKGKVMLIDVWASW